MIGVSRDGGEVISLFPYCKVVFCIINIRSLPVSYSVMYHDMSSGSLSIHLTLAVQNL